MSWWGQREVPSEAVEHRRKLKQIVRRIRAGDAGTTHSALHQLVDLTPVDDEYVVAALVEMLAYPSLQDESRQAIATAIERLFKRNDAALGGLVGLLGHLQGHIRECASQLLSRLVTLVRNERQQECVHDIAARLDSLNATTRTAVIHCLQDAVSIRADLLKLCVGALCEQLKSPKSFSRDSAIEGLVLLVHMGKREDLVNEVTACLQNKDDQVRACAVRAVGALVKEESLQEWISACAVCMDHQEAPIRKTGAEALAVLSAIGNTGGISGGKGRESGRMFDHWDMGYGKPGRACIVDDHLLQNPPPQKGVNAKSLNSRATVAHISKRLEDANAGVRQSAVASLCALRDAGEHDRIDLIRASALRLDYDNDDVRTTAVEALQHLVHGDVAEEVEVVLEWVERGGQDAARNMTRVYAIKALGRVAKHNDAKVVRALLQATSDADYRVIREALDVMGHLPHFGSLCSQCAVVESPQNTQLYSM